MRSTVLTAAAGGTSVVEEVAVLRSRFANVYFVGPPGVPHGWVLVDAGVGHCAGRIARAAAARFGPRARPAAILLTHGHFDHVGALAALVARWEVPVYAHPLELPYLTGGSRYPPADPTVGGGAMTWLSPCYPHGPVDLHPAVRRLPADGSVPGLPGWQAIFTPGHSPGHVSFFRAADRTLLAGDAVVTVRQESALAVMAQCPEVHRPPAYYTMDWAAAGDSVARLAALEPEWLATGHGPPLHGEPLQQGLAALARNWEDAIPARGRYVSRPAVTDERGIVCLPPPVPNPLPKVVAGLAIAAGLAYLALRRRR